MSSLSPEQLKIYRESAKQRRAIAHQKLLQRQQTSLQIAQTAADLLKAQFHVQKVVLFGSLLNVQRMHSTLTLISPSGV